jgi:polar amino acid transport system permease protein
MIQSSRFKRLVDVGPGVYLTIIPGAGVDQRFEGRPASVRNRFACGSVNAVETAAIASSTAAVNNDRDGVCCLRRWASFLRRGKRGNLMVMKLVKKLFWYACLAVVLVLMGWGLTVMTDRIDYKWYWNRVPQYFVFTGQVERFSSEPGKAIVQRIDAVNSRVVLKYDNGQEESYKILTDSLLIADGDPVTEITEIGKEQVVNKGILVEGLLTTLEISIYSSIAGLFIGLFAGLGRISKNPLVKGLSTIYVELIRGTPLLVQIFIFYFFLGTILHFDRLSAGILALSVFVGAYVAEIVRAGIQSIHPGQMEAARSLGMNYFQAMSYIVLPQAFKRILPPLAGQFISLIKDSSLVSVIAITDLTKAGREVITSTFAVFEIWFTVAAMYLVLTFSLSMFVRYIERRFSISD